MHLPVLILCPLEQMQSQKRVLLVFPAPSRSLLCSRPKTRPDRLRASPRPQHPTALHSSSVATSPCARWVLLLCLCLAGWCSWMACMHTRMAKMGHRSASTNLDRGTDGPHSADMHSICLHTPSRSSICQYTRSAAASTARMKASASRAACQLWCRRVNMDSIGAAWEGFTDTLLYPHTASTFNPNRQTGKPAPFGLCCISSSRRCPRVQRTNDTLALLAREMG